MIEANNWTLALKFEDMEENCKTIAVRLLRIAFINDIGI